jgi:hypothetical protein
MYVADGDYIQDIEVNDLRNRYLLTKGSTQKMVNTPDFKPTDHPRAATLDLSLQLGREYHAYSLIARLNTRFVSPADSHLIRSKTKPALVRNSFMFFVGHHIDLARYYHTGQLLS